MQHSQKCIVAGCNNHQHEGRFQTFDLCAPCYYMLSAGTVSNNGTTFIHALRDEVEKHIPKICCGAIDRGNSGCENCVPRLQNQLKMAEKTIQDSAMKMIRASNLLKV